ncbi:MAG: hypothetical protein FJX76_10565 [Armatimonadetes bacterium]|nr:hypothetical protein [Armatimonadota bacterium]
MSPRGLVLPTALFAVLCIYALITAVQLTVSQNYQVTRQGHDKTRARYLAHAACQLVLKGLNEDAGFEAAHKGFDARLVTPMEGGRLESWVEPTDKTDVILVRGLGTLDNGASQPFGLTVRKRPIVAGRVYTRPGVSNATTFYGIAAERLTSGAATPEDWQPVPPVPNTYYDSKGNVVDGTSDESTRNDFTAFARWVAADTRGNLFAIRYREDRPDTVLKLDGTTQKWSLLPPVPNSRYSSAGTLIPTTTTASALTDLVSDGDNRLYVRNGKDGIDTVWTMDLSATTPSWSALPPTPLHNVDRYGNSTPVPNRFVGNLRDFSAAPDGTLFARHSREGVDALYKYDGRWSLLPPTPKTYYRRVRDPLTGQYMLEAVQSEDGLAAYNLKGLSSNRDSELYAVFSRDGIDTIYKYDGSKWEVLPPAPAIFLQNAALETTGGTSTQGAGNVTESAVDGAGNLYVRWVREGVDSLFMYSPDRGRYWLVPPIPNRQWSKRGPSPTLLDYSDRTGNQGILPNLYELTGGGKRDPAGRWRYTPKGTF